jgi:hypothetical protein
MVETNLKIKFYIHFHWLNFVESCWMENKEIHQFFTNNQNKSIGERKPFLTKHETEVLKLNNENKIVKENKTKN